MDDNSYSTYCPSLGMDDNRTVTATVLASDGGGMDNNTTVLSRMGEQWVWMITQLC